MKSQIDNLKYQGLSPRLSPGETVWKCAMRCICFAALFLIGCTEKLPTELEQRHGDEIIVAGKFFRIGAPVITWLDPGGYDAYRTERRFVEFDESSWEATTQSSGESKPKSPNRFNLRYESTAAQHYTPEQLEQIRGGGWTLELLQETIDQFVIHYDSIGFSQNCFKTLQDVRGLSVHFMLDLDGTIYQTLDVKERAWHATKSNDRSVGIEIASVGGYPPGQIKRLYKDWFVRDADGVNVQIPESYGDEAKRLSAKKLRPSRSEPIIGTINGDAIEMYDFTPQQYDSLVKLTAALCEIFPRIKPEAPRDANGKIINNALSEDAWQQFSGVLGHYHVQKNKQDPGPAFQWDDFLSRVRRQMKVWRESK